MAHPLELSYNWRTPSTLASVALVICLGAVGRSQLAGWVWVVVVFSALWVAFMVLVYLRARAYLMVDGSVLVLRPWRRVQHVDGPDVVALREVSTPSGPSYKVVVKGLSRRGLTAPTALLRDGEATLFAWILTYAPQASLDPASLRTLEELRTRGLVK